MEAGVIDEDYRGEVAVLLRSHDQICLYPKGHAIAQLIIQPYLKPDVLVVDNLDVTVRYWWVWFYKYLSLKLYHF